MKFRMKIEDLFKVGDKTIFAGTLDTEEAVIYKALCAIEIDGKEVNEVEIEGEVRAGSGHRDLWTKSYIDLDRNLFDQHEVWLIAK